ncbi:MAG: metallophosphoesterase [Bacillota bacterium]
MRLISRRSFILGGSALLLYSVYYSTTAIAVKQYNVWVKNLPNSFNKFTILHLSDLHSKLYGAKQKELLALINRYHYDMTAITGDLDSKSNPNAEPGIHLVEGLLSKPVYFVPGNHDWATGYYFKDTIRAMGVKILENAEQQFFKNGESIWIVGVDDPYSGRADLTSALAHVNSQSPRILLAHAPEIYSKAVQEQIDLVLVGHTHGGQFRIPFVGAVVVPGQGFFPKLDYGLYYSDQTTMVINAGLGESVLPIRFNSRPEIVFVTLICADN